MHTVDMRARLQLALLSCRVSVRKEKSSGGRILDSEWRCAAKPAMAKRQARVI